MATFEIETPDGRRYRIEAPDGASEQDALAHFRKTVEQRAAPPIIGGTDPTGSTWENIAAGARKAVADTGRGFRQLGSYVGLGDRKAIQQEIDDAKRLDAPLMNTGGGITGNVIGHVGMALIPGMAAKVAAMLPQLARAAPGLNIAADALLAPKTIPGALALGGAQGFVQPTAGDESRAANTALGAVGSATIPTAIAAAKVGKSLVAPFTHAGQERLAGRALERFASNANTITSPPNAGPLVPGARPTLAEATGDIGLADLQRVLANNPEAKLPLVERQLANRAARETALRDIAGNPADRAAWVAAREAVAKENYGKAFAEVPTLTPWVKGQIAQLQKRPSFQEAWPQATRLAREEGLRLDPANTVQVAHYTKLALDDMIGGAEGHAQRALIGTRDKLVSLMESKDFAPAYRAARETYADMSKPINQIDVGQALLDKFQPALADYGATARQTAGRYADAMRNADVTAQRATGFKGATMANVLGPQQMQTAENVARDLARMTQAQELPQLAGGRQSLTAQNLIGQDLLGSVLGPLGLPKSWGASEIAGTALRPVSWAYKLPENKVLKALGVAAADADEAKRLLLAARKRGSLDALDELLPFVPALGSGGLLGLR